MLRDADVLRLAAACLLGLGIIFVHSAGATIDVDSANPVYLTSVWCSRQAVYAAIALLAMWIASRLNVRRLLISRGRGPLSPLGWLMALAIGLAALTLVPGLGKSVNGARRWLTLGPQPWAVTFQPSELVKWALFLAIAGWCARRRGVMNRFWYGLAPILSLTAGSCALVAVEDLGTAALIGLVATCLLIAGGARLWQLATMIPPVAAAVALAIIHSPYRLARLTTFLDPWSDPLGRGYHSIQSMLAIAQGGLAGRGLGNGIQKLGYLPEDTTDFMFAVICEELGIIGACLVMGLYLAVICSGLSIVRRCPDLVGKLVALGVLLAIGLQALINMAVVTVLVPTKGIALPLLSAGGTGWVLTATALGLVAGLDRVESLAPMKAFWRGGRHEGIEVRRHEGLGCGQ